MLTITPSKGIIEPDKKSFRRKKEKIMAEDKPNEKIKVQPLTPAPLLIVLASFDPSGEGVNHYDPEHPELLTDKTSKYYGEQWAISPRQPVQTTRSSPSGGR